MPVLINSVEIVPDTTAAETDRNEAEPAEASQEPPALATPDLDAVIRQREERMSRVYAH